MDPSADLTVIIPTYRRARALEQCLEALANQTAMPACVLVVVRRGDSLTSRVAARSTSRLPVTIVEVSRPGQVHALNEGLRRAQSDVVCFTDDDARPWPHWLEAVATHFEDPTVGAVGGRDVVHHGHRVDHGKVRRVGRVRWFGRVEGFHHFEAPLQEVQFLKGANMSFRRGLLPGFDEHLAGDGSQICNDLQVSLRVHRAGWRVVWDPDVGVDHFPAQRFDDDARERPSLRAVANVLHNQTYVLLSLLPAWHKVTSLLYALVIGTRSEPGPFLVPVSLAGSRTIQEVWFGFRAGLLGRVRGAVTYVRTKGRPYFSGRGVP